MENVMSRDIEAAIKKDSRWTPKIFVDIPPPVTLKEASVVVEPEIFSNTTVSKDEAATSTDIVPYLLPPDKDRLSIYQNLNYPTECVYRFDRFQGIHNKDKLRNYLITQSTISSATDLTKGTTKKPLSSQFLDIVCLQCVCYRVTRSKPCAFETGKNQ